MHLQVGCAIPGKYAFMPQNSPPYSLAVTHVTQTYLEGEAPNCIPGKCRVASLLKFLNREGKHQTLKGQESKAGRHSIEVGALPSCCTADVVRLQEKAATKQHSANGTKGLLNKVEIKT